MTASNDRIRVMIVDDSTFVRKALRRMLRDEPDLEIVAEVRDGQHAIEAARQLQPDVMTLDLQMPGLSGMDVLRALAVELPTRIIMVSSLTREGAEETFAALDEGAFDFVDKNMAQNRLDFTRLRDDLVTKIRAAAGVKKPPQHQHADAAQDSRPPAQAPETQSAAPPQPYAPSRQPPCGLVVIGASTGGPPTIRRLLQALPRSPCAALLVAQHMPPGFTDGFARRLAQVAPTPLHEARDGDAVFAGHTYVIPAGRELWLTAGEEPVRWRIRLRDAVEDPAHRPSVNQTLASAAAVAGERVLAVILTGMGSDGADGAATVVAAGGRVMIQDRDSSTIYGMPRAVAERVRPVFEGTPEALAAQVMEHVEQWSM